MKISIIGSGTVGYAVGKGFSEFGHDVLFCDVSEKRMGKLKEIGENAICENKVRDITFIAVPAPTKNDGTIELRYLTDALRDVGVQLREREDYPHIVIKSTILPHLLRGKLIPLLEETSRKKVSEDFGFCYNPEFLREKHAQEDFMHPDRIILGACDTRTAKTLEELYRPFDAPIYQVGLEEAAMAKYVANNFLSTKISYFNEMYLIAKEWGIDPDMVSTLVKADRRISEYGTVGGREFGGRCLPKDLNAFLHFSNKKNNPKILQAVKQVNDKMKDSKHRRDIEVD
ncbi:MAG: UDP-glucose/GDP-mannose dehydrogenase family protein [Candidatus Korarchaeota archaeon]|nr:UDP-glucose/GDP-mannose dehydrogenase family protein [Candidatus Korarchaeota archaeon]NIU83081.1 nucleotide sugar dehydrogenase [Candidatus Thorarchaeota archaeon]NIW12625.1 nucleotide sugar dehydrogenase [Candidatus Thorarchaeota archaeon]NIW50836.1 nucleotide sugar dehydrogenase [Candidatus Korarchaeota archaeon]